MRACLAAVCLAERFSEAEGGWGRGVFLGLDFGLDVEEAGLVVGGGSSRDVMESMGAAVVVFLVGWSESLSSSKMVFRFAAGGREDRVGFLGTLRPKESFDMLVVTTVVKIGGRRIEGVVNYRIGTCKDSRLQAASSRTSI